eukprot:1520861-Amphidinium_carterae.1
MVEADFIGNFRDSCSYLSTLGNFRGGGWSTSLGSNWSKADMTSLKSKKHFGQTCLGVGLEGVSEPCSGRGLFPCPQRLSTISDVTEKFRETALQAQGNLRCEDSDYDVPGQHAVFSAFLELVQIASLPTNLEREWDENLEEGVLNCSDVAALCDLARTRTLCPNVCECARVRSGRYDFSGCPAA